MDEVEEMWMEMVVLRIDLMNSWCDLHRSDRCEVDDIGIQTHEALEGG